MARIYEGTHDFSGATVIGVSTAYDAIVAASGGDYTTLGAAITAGKTNIYVRAGTYTETGDITLPSYCRVTGQAMIGTIIQMGTYLLTTGNNNNINNLAIYSSRLTHQIILGSDSVVFNNLFILNQGVNAASKQGLISDNNVARGNIYIQNCIIRPNSANLDKGNWIGLYQINAGSIQWYVTNTTLNGQGSTFECISAEMAGKYNRFTNCVWHEFGQSGSDILIVTGTYNHFVSCIFRSTNVGNISVTGAGNVFVDTFIEGTTIPLEIDGDNIHLNSVLSKGALTNASGGDGNNITGCTFNTGITLGGNNTVISGCRVGADAGGGGSTITISGGATTTVITGCLTDVAISDGGTGTVGANNEVY